MRKKALSWLLSVSLMLSLFVSATLTAHAAEVTQAVYCDAEVLDDSSFGCCSSTEGPAARHRERREIFIVVYMTRR
jgi:hypothetical protein